MIMALLNLLIPFIYDAAAVRIMNKHKMWVFVMTDVPHCDLTVSLTLAFLHPFQS